MKLNFRRNKVGVGSGRLGLWVPVAAVGVGILSTGGVTPPAHTATVSAAPYERAADTFRVAFFADTSYVNLKESDLVDLDDYQDTSLKLPGRVMKLVRAEGADMALHGGDMGYNENGKAVPEKWDRMVTQILGADYPLFASGGNHDQKHWFGAPPDTGLDGLGYRDLLRRRYEAVEASPFGEDLECSFYRDVDDIGQRASCNYKDILTFVTVGLGEGNGITPTEFGAEDNPFEAYLKSALEASTTPWTVCNWHFNQNLFQTGRKPNQAGWKPYEYCREAGALIATGHEHSYSRTHLMSRFWEGASEGDIASSDDDLIIDEMLTIAWVSGLGGAGPRVEREAGKKPWWAAKVNKSNHPLDGGGALFCDFSTTSNSNAQCYYKTVEGNVRDEFELVSNANGATGTFDDDEPAITCAGRDATIVGTPGDDTLTGSGGDDVIVGLGGNDTITGLDGNDVICAGDGDDNVLAGPGADEVFGELGDDSLFGQSGADVIDGADGSDQLWGGPGNDTVSGGDGDDLVNGSYHADTLNGDRGNDTVVGGVGPDAMNGGPGVDNCDGGPGTDAAASCETVKSAP